MVCGAQDAVNFMKRFDRFRARRRKAYERLFSARSLYIAGLLAMPSLLFNPFPMLRVAQFLFFWFLCWLAGKKNNPFMTIAVTVGITAFNLIVPYGRVLYSIGTFDITLGALLAGIQRAVTLGGLIMLSRLSIRPDLKIPGGFGALVSESFRFFAIIMDSKKRIARKSLIDDIDRLMIDLSNESEGDREITADAYRYPAINANAEYLTPRHEAIAAARTKAAGFIILTVVVILSWLCLAWIFHADSTARTA